MDDYDPVDRTGVSTSTVTAFFDDRSDAERAIARLRDIGVPEHGIRLTEGSQTGGGTVDRRTESRGFFEMLGDFFFPTADRSAYAEGLARGGHLVTATGLSDDLYEMALDILDEDGAIDLEERSANWRAEGWDGNYDEPPAVGHMSDGTYDDQDRVETGLGNATVSGGMREDRGGAELASAEPYAGDTERGAARRGEDGPVAAAMASAVSGVLPGSYGGQGMPSQKTQATSESELLQSADNQPWGKRDLSHGRTRVRSYRRDDGLTDVDGNFDDDLPAEDDGNRP